MIFRRLAASVAVGAAVIVVAGVAYSTFRANSGSTSAAAFTPTATTTDTTPGLTLPAKGGSNARSGAAAGGMVGTVRSIFVDKQFKVVGAE